MKGFFPDSGSKWFILKFQGDRAAIKRLLPDLVPIMKSEDFKEGIQSFLERRDANFKGV